MNDAPKTTRDENDKNATASKTQQLCRVFSTTVSSLASDTVALNQIKSLAVECCGEENNHPNNETIRKGLCQVNDVISELEQKVNMLFDIVAEEKQSLQDLESVKNAAEAQHQVLLEMQQACDNAIRQQEAQEKESPPVLTITAPTRPVSTTSVSTPRNCQESTQTHHTEGLLRSGAKRVVRRDSVDPRDKRHSNISTPVVRLDRVTEREWINISKTVRGRITLAVVNDALRDIERVFQKKYAVLKHAKTVSRKNAPPGQMELQQKLLNSHRELQVEEHGSDPWVSEQDLRQCCAFFRNGESTARAILLIIRTVRRLKQVPAKHSQVTYVYQSSME